MTMSSSSSWNGDLSFKLLKRKSPSPHWEASMAATPASGYTTLTLLSVRDPSLWQYALVMSQYFIWSPSFAIMAPDKGSKSSGTKTSTMILAMPWFSAEVEAMADLKRQSSKLFGRTSSSRGSAAWSSGSGENERSSSASALHKNLLAGEEGPFGSRSPLPPPLGRREASADLRLRALQAHFEVADLTAGLPAALGDTTPAVILSLSRYPVARAPNAMMDWTMRS